MNKAVWNRLPVRRLSPVKSPTTAPRVSVNCPHVHRLAPTKWAAAVALVATVALAGQAQAYSINPGDLLIKGVVGPSINVLRLDVATKAAPPAGLMVGVDIDYALDGNWSLAGSLRPTLSPGFIDGSVGFGARYRLLQLDAPFIPWALGQLTAGIGGPVGYGDLHTAAGLRLGCGVDYFVLRDLALGVEVSTEPQVLFLPLTQLQWSAEALLAVTWRF
jgi:hypothetical protein